MSPQPDLHAVAAALLFGRPAVVFLQRLFDVVAIGMWKVAPFDARQALIEGELIIWNRAVTEPTTDGCLEGILQLEALVPLVAGFLVFRCQERTLPCLLGQNSGTPDAVAISLNPVTVDPVNLNNEEAPVASLRKSSRLQVPTMIDRRGWASIKRP